MNEQPAALSAEDRDYLTTLGPASLNEGPGTALDEAWQACLRGDTDRPAGIRRVIWASWLRSVNAGLDPEDGEYRFVAPADLTATLAANRVLIAALKQVSDDYSAQQSLIDQVAAEERARDAASQAWDLARQRYQAGVGSHLEALVVRQQLLGSEQRLAALKASQVDFSVRLIQALGGGYRPSELEQVPVAAPFVPPTPTRP